MIEKNKFNVSTVTCLAAWLCSMAVPAAHGDTKGALSYACDDECLAPGAPVPAGKYAVVSPVGKHTVEMIKQAPRLDTLDGKTIAVV